MAMKDAQCTLKRVDVRQTNGKAPTRFNVFIITIPYRLIATIIMVNADQEQAPLTQRKCRFRAAAMDSQYICC